MTSNKDYFYLFANCIPVLGSKRSIIIDTQRECLYFIPNALYHILQETRNLSVQNIKDYFKNDEIVNSYFDFLTENELGIYVHSFEAYPQLDYTYRVSCKVNNAILEIEPSEMYDIRDVSNQLSNLGCANVEIRVLSHINYDKLLILLSDFDGSSIKRIDLSTPHEEAYTEERIIELLRAYPRVSNLYIYNAPSYRELTYNPHYKVFFVTKKTISNDQCGNISKRCFYITLENITESMKYNSCLHRKISISANGNIKNCPSSNTCHGNIKSNKLKDIICLDNFKKIWSIKKDDIEVCKDCEFRYICLDCRAFLSNKNNILSKPLKCSYNPYTAQWE